MVTLFRNTSKLDTRSLDFDIHWTPYITHGVKSDVRGCQLVLGNSAFDDKSTHSSVIQNGIYQELSAPEFAPTFSDR